MTNATSILFGTLALNFMCIAFAFDASPLLDFCVANGAGGCKDPKTVTANDFFFSGLNKPGNTSNPYHVSATTVSSSTVPGLNGMGMTFMRVDMAPNGFFPPHIHARATELVTVLEGSMEIRFITSYPQYQSFTKILKAGDVFVVPVGLVHTVQNVDKGNTVAMVAFNSQNPGIFNIPNGLFAAKPPLNSGYLAGAFKLDQKTIEDLQKKF